MFAICDLILDSRTVIICKKLTVPGRGQTHHYTSDAKAHLQTPEISAMQRSRHWNEFQSSLMNNLFNSLSLYDVCLYFSEWSYSDQRLWNPNSMGLMYDCLVNVIQTVILPGRNNVNASVLHGKLLILMLPVWQQWLFLPHEIRTQDYLTGNWDRVTRSTGVSWTAFSSNTSTWLLNRLRDDTLKGWINFN